MLKKQTRSKFRPEFPLEYDFDFKDAPTLSRFLSEGGKIVPARISKLSASQQRAVTREIKRARNLALLPNGMDAFDHYPKADAISPVPFDLNS